jgi:hypothetical protein
LQDNETAFLDHCVCDDDGILDSCIPANVQVTPMVDYAISYIFWIGIAVVFLKVIKDSINPHE